MHLCRGYQASDNQWYDEPKLAFANILRTRWIIPSTNPLAAAAYYSKGSDCFYDVPPPWDELTLKNDKARPGFGVIVRKDALWFLGGRPVIYTERPKAGWPEEELYRVVRTDPLDPINPCDWLHEREWRVRDGLFVGRADLDARYPEGWWWPCVPTPADISPVQAEFPDIRHIVSLRTG